MGATLPGYQNDKNTPRLFAMPARGSHRCSKASEFPATGCRRPMGPTYARWPSRTPHKRRGMTEYAGDNMVATSVTRSGGPPAAAGTLSTPGAPRASGAGGTRGTHTAPAPRQRPRGVPACATVAAPGTGPPRPGSSRRYSPTDPSRAPLRGGMRRERPGGDAIWHTC